MPWKECKLMDEKMKFVARIFEGEKMAPLCREYGISRKTGYKLFERYKDEGLQGLTDRSRRPHRYANQLPIQIEKAILRIKHDKPNWGAPKIRELFKRKYPELQLPSKSTIHTILDKNGLVKHKRKRHGYKAQGTPLSTPKHPNVLGCADYKGEFMLGNRRYCYPLTITDFSSRYLLACEGLYTTKEPYAFGVFERVFKEFGLPHMMRTDNGVPFSSPHALFGLSRLSVWWLRLGIHLERIEPGKPQQNGRHERMHLTLKKEATKPTGHNLLQQQEKFDAFIQEYNYERPHQALDMRVPAEIYKASTRPYLGLPELEYPFHDQAIMVTNCGRICVRSKKIHLSGVLAGQKIGLKEVNDQIWLVSFMDYDLGYFDEEERKFQPLDNPFGAKVLPMCPV